MKMSGEDYLSCVLGRLSTRSTFYFMDYFIAYPFSASLARLTGDEQKSAQIAMRGLQVSDSSTNAKS